MTSGRMPKLFHALRHYNLPTFAADLIAGITVGLVALSLAMAFAISSGVAPETGLYCAVIAGFLISALGGSKVQIGGPTGAFVVIVFAIAAEYGLNGLFVCTIMAGVFLVVLGLTGLGTAVCGAFGAIHSAGGAGGDSAHGRLQHGGRREIPKLLKMPKADICVWLVTFGLTVFADLTLAVEFGMVLAALLFIHNVAMTTTVTEVTKEYVDDGRLHMTAIDASGLLALEEFADKLRSTGRVLLLCGARPQPAKLMKQAEFERHIGKHNICSDIDAALNRAVLYHISTTVTHRVAPQSTVPPAVPATVLPGHTAT